MDPAHVYVAIVVVILQERQGVGSVVVRSRKESVVSLESIMKVKKNGTCFLKNEAKKEIKRTFQV